MFAIRKLHDNSVVKLCDNYTEVMKFIGDEAAEYNCGIYRTWPTTGGTCYDTSKNVYFVEEVDELD